MILFFASSGIEIGIGHVKRCTQLSLELSKLEQRATICLSDDLKSIEIIKKEGCSFSVIEKGETIPDVIRRHSDVQLIVLDLLNISGKDTQQIRHQFPAIKILALDYFDMKDDQVNTIINLYNHSKGLKKPASAAVKYLEGPAYGILRTEFQTILEKTIVPKKFIKKILVTFGGADPRRHTLNVIPVLHSILKQLELKVTVVTGPNFTHEKEVIKMLDASENGIERVHDPANMSQLMNESDLCICGSGTTIMELAALGTPALIAPQSTEELGFSSIFETAGFAVVIGTPEAIDSPKLEAILLDYHVHPSKLTAASRVGPALCDGKGKERIIQEIKILIEN